MARASREQAAEHHGEIVTAASRLFRERGIKATSVPDIMGAAGLTHGGFYKHFPSKEALAAAACADGFAWLKGLLETIEARHPKSPPAARADLIAGYLAPAHRDDPGDGCPAIAWGNDVAREPADSPVRAAYAAGIDAVVDRMTEGFDARSRQAAITDYATLVGALLLARATGGTALSDEVLSSVRTAMTASPRRPKKK